jgi:hypothetical protein
MRSKFNSWQEQPNHHRIIVNTSDSCFENMSAILIGDINKTGL